MSLKAVEIKLAGLESGLLSKNFIAMDYARDVVKREIDILEKAVRENAVPEIKGPITAGKLRWRGIKMIQQKNMDETVKWIEQRGKIISPKIIFKFSK